MHPGYPTLSISMELDGLLYKVLVNEVKFGKTMFQGTMIGCAFSFDLANP
jgi:hypothetical protein